jgi:hypothetical protein
MIARVPNEISGIESNLDVCFYQKKACARSVDHGPRGSTIHFMDFQLLPDALIMLMTNKRAKWAIRSTARR